MKTASREKRTSAGSAAGFEPDISILKVLKYDNQNNLICIYTVYVLYIYIKNNKALFPLAYWVLAYLVVKSSKTEYARNLSPKWGKHLLSFFNFCHPTSYPIITKPLINSKFLIIMDSENGHSVSCYRDTLTAISCILWTESRIRQTGAFKNDQNVVFLYAAAIWSGVFVWRILISRKFF